MRRKSKILLNILKAQQAKCKNQWYDNVKKALVNIAYYNVSRSEGSGDRQDKVEEYDERKSLQQWSTQSDYAQQGIRYRGGTRKGASIDFKLVFGLA